MTCLSNDFSSKVFRNNFLSLKRFFEVKVQKSMFLYKKWLKHLTFIKMRNGCHQMGHSGLEKHQTFKFSLLGVF